MGYNIIAVAGFVLPKIALLIMMILMLRKSNISWNTWFESALLALSIYYFMALIIHPWYIISLVFLGVFTRFQFQLLWSALIFLSYSAYQTESYSENYYLLAIEYLMVYGIFFWEFFRSKEMT